MAETQVFDWDEHVLEFKSDTEEEEREFYVQTFSNVDNVIERCLHCTACNLHIGAAPSCVSVMRMHPVLRVTLCKKCYEFYNSGEFAKGRDGSEMYCRWCGQGGQVYCCSKCPYVFCKKCIVRNLPLGTVKVIEETEIWECFSCSPKIIWPLRAIHWAHSNYLEKMRKKFLVQHTNDDDIYEAMRVDPTACCDGEKKPKNALAVPPRIMKRRNGNSSTNDSKDAKKTRESSDSGSILLKTNKTSSPNGTPVSLTYNSISPMPELAQAPIDNVVCTPDIKMMFGDMNSTEPTPLSIHRIASVMNPTAALSHSLAVYPRNQSTPIAIVTERDTVVDAQRHVFHKVGGFTVDLNEASKTEHFQLPNGKLIKVRRKEPPVVIEKNRNGPIQPNPVVQCKNPNLNNTMHNHEQVMYHQKPLQQKHIHQQQQLEQLQFEQKQHQLQESLHQKQLNQHKQTIKKLQQQLTLAQVQLNRSKSLRMQTYPTNALGQALTRLQSQIISTQDVCQYTIGKLNTLVNSNAYKKVRNLNDVKDLHITVSYLYKYTLARIKEQYEFHQEDIQALDIANDASNSLADRQANYKSGDDDLKIVEKTQVLIDLDSESETENRDHIQQRPDYVNTSSSSISKKQNTRALNQNYADADLVTVCVSDDSDCDTELPIPPILGGPEDIQNEAQKQGDGMSPISTTSSEYFTTISMESKSPEKYHAIKHDEHTESSKSSNITLIEPVVPDTENRDKFIGVNPNDVEDSNDITEPTVSDELIKTIPKPIKPDCESKNQTNVVELYNPDQSITIFTEHSLPDHKKKNQPNGVYLDAPNQIIIDLTEPSTSDLKNKDQCKTGNAIDADKSIHISSERAVSKFASNGQIEDVDLADESINIITKLSVSVNMDANELISHVTKHSVSDSQNINHFIGVDPDDSDVSINNIAEPSVFSSSVQYDEGDGEEGMDVEYALDGLIDPNVIDEKDPLTLEPLEESNCIHEQNVNVEMRDNTLNEVGLSLLDTADNDDDQENMEIVDLTDENSFCGVIENRGNIIDDTEMSDHFEDAESN